MKKERGNKGIALTTVVIIIIILVFIVGVGVIMLTKNNRVQEGNNIQAQGTNTQNDETKDENIVGPTLADKIKPENYGDYINYNKDLTRDGNTANDWRIFYKDDKNVYIIAKDYLSNSLLPETAGISIQDGYTYSAYWPTNKLTKQGSADINETISNKYMLSWRNNNPKSTNNNVKAIASLLDPEAWKDFATGVDGAEAVGAPTLEMFIASWNEKGYTKLYCDNTNNRGYYVGKNSNPSTLVCDVSSDEEGYNDSLYYPYITAAKDCYGYWLASPSAEGMDKLLFINYEGTIDIYEYYYRYGGVRPIVCLPATAQGEQGPDGIWTINK